MAECKMWVNMESKGVESKMENNFKLVLNDKTEIKYFNNLYSIKEYLSKAEYYLMNILSDIECGSNAFVDWNMILDFNGGPTHANNPCAAPIILDEKGKNYIDVMKENFRKLGFANEFAK